MNVSSFARALLAASVLSSGCAAPRAPHFHTELGERVVLIDTQRDDAPDVIVALPDTVHLVQVRGEEAGDWSVTWSTSADGTVVLDHPQGNLALPCVGGLKLRPDGDGWVVSTWASLWKGDVLQDVTVPAGVGARPGILLGVGPQATPFRCPDTAMTPSAARDHARTLEEREAGE